MAYIYYLQDMGCEPMPIHDNFLIVCIHSEGDISIQPKCFHFAFVNPPVKAAWRIDTLGM
jgi:hypothetical protein